MSVDHDIPQQVPVRVLMVVTLFSIGGATETVVSIAGGLRTKGYSVDIVTGPPLPSEGDMYNAASLQHIPVMTLTDMVRSVHPLKDLSTFRQLVRIMKSGRYDIVHTNSSKAGILGRWAAWFAGVPVVVHTIHGLPFHDFQPVLLKKMFIWIERSAARISTAIVSVSHAMIDQCLAVGIGRREQFVVIRSGFEVGQYIDSAALRHRLRSQYGLTNDHVAAGTISRLADLKGHKFILAIAPELCREFPNLRLFFIGDGEIRKQLEREARELGLEKHILFTGLLDPEEIPGIVAAMDFIVHPSLREGLARVLPQSVISGKKVVSFALDGVSEVIQSESAGYVVPVEDIAALKEACHRLCEDASCRTVPEQVRAAVAEEFSVETMVQRTADLYETLMKRSRSTPAERMPASGGPVK